MEVWFVHLGFSMLAGEKNCVVSCGVSQGFLRKVWCRTWFFGGVIMVNCVVNVVLKHRIFRDLKMRQLF
jgi:hypothetical protein